MMSAETFEARMVAYRLGQLKKEGFEKVQVPVGHCGKWKEERFVIDQEGASHHNMLEAIHGRRRMVMPGEYTRLCYGDEVVMSDTPAEMDEHRSFVFRAQGQVLIMGLGLGVCLAAVARKPEVHHVTVVERSEEVVALVGPHYRTLLGPRLT